MASAFGLLVAPMSYETVRTYRGRLDQASAEDLQRLFGEMQEEARRRMPAGFGAAASCSSGLPISDRRRLLLLDDRRPPELGPGHEIRPGEDRVRDEVALARTEGEPLGVPPLGGAPGRR